MINIKVVNGKIWICQTYPVTDEVCEKIKYHIDRVIACLKDMRVNYSLTEEELVLYKEMESVSEKDIKVFKTMCNTVMDFIEKLPVPKPVIDVSVQTIDKQVEENLKFCKSVLEEYDETEDDFGIVGAIIYCGSDDKEIAMPCGCIDRKLFRELLTLYVEKYGNCNKNKKSAESTAS